MIITLLFKSLKWFNASSDKPLAREASPTRAIISLFSFFKSLAIAIPIAVESAVPACPVSYES